MKRRFSISVHPAGVCLLACAFLFAPSAQVLAAALALLLHEIAHMAAMRLCGAGDCRVEITPFGGMADARAFEKMSCLRQAISAGAGVAMSAACAWMTRNAAGEFGLCFHHASASLALLNSLPAWPLDGARILLALAGKLGCRNAACRIMTGVAGLLGLTMLGLGLLGAWYGVINPSLFLTGPYLWYAARQGNVADRLRRLGSTENKLASRAFLPVTLYAAQGKVRSLFPAVLGRNEAERYVLLAEIEPQDGSLKRLWTEQEMKRTALMEDIVASSAVDKASSV